MTAPPPERTDPRMMQRALMLAARGSGMVSPNPMVGAVIARGRRIIGEGFHRRYGGPHAEIEALKQSVDPRGATLYVTLEPCHHQGKTPACTAAIIQSGIQHVVCAVQDPNPLVSGKGMAGLKRAGIQVDTGVLEEEARNINAPFFKFHNTGLPYVTAKWAMTLDGKIATSTKDSRWVSHEKSRKCVHTLRRRVDAIMIGIQTVLADDPLLTPRPSKGRRPMRVVIDSRARIPLRAKLVTTSRDFPLLVAVSHRASRRKCNALERAGCHILVCPDKQNRVDLKKVLRHLAGREGRLWILAEGGGGVLGTLFDGKLVDQVQVYVAPKIVGGKDAASAVLGHGVKRMRQAWEIDVTRTMRIHHDRLIEGNLLYP